MKRIIIALLMVVLLAGCTATTAPVTVTQTVTPTELPGDPAVSIEITFHFEVGGLAAEGIELFINEACTMPLIDPVYVPEVIQPGNTYTFPFFAKNTGDTELTVTTATGGDTPGCNLYLTPAQATLTPGAVIPLELNITVVEFAQAGNYTGYFVITAS